MSSMFDDPTTPDGTAPAATPSPAPAGNAWTPDEEAAARTWATNYITQHQIPAGYGGATDLMNSYFQQRQNGIGHDQAMATVPGLLGWDKYTPTKPTDPNPTPTPPPPPPPGGTLTAPFPGVYTPAGSASANPNPLPTVAGSVSTIPGAPAFPTIPRFSAPTMDEAMNDPGYKFTLDQGNTNLTNWLASRGMQNDSSAAKALIDYGQGAATTQYGNVWDRAVRSYDENVGTQYLQPFQAAFQNWQAGTVNPTMTNFSTNAANVSHLNDVSWQDNWNQFLQKFNQFQDQRDSTFNKQFQTATA